MKSSHSSPRVVKMGLRLGWSVAVNVRRLLRATAFGDSLELLVDKAGGSEYGSSENLTCLFVSCIVLGAVSIVVLFSLDLSNKQTVVRAMT